MHKKSMHLVLHLTFLISLSIFNQESFDVIYAMAAVANENIISFCSGESHTCAVFSNKKAKCWGQKAMWGMVASAGDKLGDDPSELDGAIPFIDFGTNITIDKISCGNNHVCVKTGTGDLKCLGGNDYGQVGLGINTYVAFVGEWNNYIGDNLPVINLGDGLKVLDIAAAQLHACVIVTGNKVKCFGVNLSGELGLGDTNSRGALSTHMGENLEFVDLGTNVEVATIHTGAAAAHKCVIVSAPANANQRIKCWGFNSNCQLGIGDCTNRGDDPNEMGDDLVFINLGAESRVKQLALGIWHTCAVKVDDEMKCWGRATYGQIASGTVIDVTGTGDSIPIVTIDSGKTIKFITAGYTHTCIVYDNQLTMKCFGSNNVGQLGQEDTSDRGNTLPTTIPNIPAINLGTGSLKISSIHAGISYNCVVFENGKAKCFGDNSFGQLAIGATSSLGDGPGEMGNNLEFIRIFSPTQSPTKSPTNPTPPTSIPTRTPTFPTKSPTSSPTPLAITKKPLLSICTGQYFACSLFNTKQAKCWGRAIGWGSSSDVNVRLGDDPSELDGAIPFIDFGTNITIDKISCGNSHVCAKTEAGDMKCVGSNDQGQTGQGIVDDPIGTVNGFTGDNLPFINLGSGSHISDIVMGLSRTCVLFANKKVKCFGRNYVGELGLGDTSSRGTASIDMGSNLLFLDFGAGVEVASIHSGAVATHSCVILSAPANIAQRAKCWGYNGSGQLGYGDIDIRGDNLSDMGDGLLLLELGDESRVKQIAVGGAHTCALIVDGTLKCFGYGIYGQLGSGSDAEIRSLGIALPSVQIDSGKTIKFITAGTFHNCIVYEDQSTMKCFGLNSAGQLGQGDTSNRGSILPTTIPNIPAIDLGAGILKILSIHGDANFNCVVLQDKNVKCFGEGNDAQLATGSLSNIGGQAGEMGIFLQNAKIFPPTQSPTTSPTRSPSNAPTKSPTKAPTFSPTKKPTISPTFSPTSKPTTSPTRKPTTYTPSKNPTKTPTISAPNTLKPTTSSPTTNESVTNAHISMLSMASILVATFIIAIGATE